jgi:2'-5' RNA ligase
LLAKLYLEIPTINTKIISKLAYKLDMENSIFNQYLANIKPNWAVTSDVMKMKRRCADDFGIISAIYSRPHFTVFDIIQHPQNEERLINILKRNIENISPFQIELYGFDYFSSSTYTLYVKLKDEKEFSEMVRYIKEFFRPILKSVKDYPPHYNTKNAHLTIAKGMSESEFLSVWQSWENAEYQANTIADHILLLKKPFSHANSKYEIIGDFPLLGKGTPTPQISLF